MLSAAWCLARWSHHRQHSTKVLRQLSNMCKGYSLSVYSLARSRATTAVGVREGLRVRECKANANINHLNLPVYEEKTGAV